MVVVAWRRGVRVTMMGGALGQPHSVFGGNLMYNLSRSVTYYLSYVCQKGLQEAQNAPLSPAKRPIQGFAEAAFVAVRLTLTLYGQPR